MCSENKQIDTSFEISKKMTSLLILILDYEKINKKIILYLAIWSKFQLSKNYY